jgi:tetratricopeptide (TPR) repeat protein
LHPALGLAESLGRNDALLPVLSGLSINLHNQGRIIDALRWTDRMLKAADATGDVEMRISGHTQAVVSYFWLGRLAESREHGERLLACADGARRAQKRKAGLASTYATSRTILGCCASQSTWMLGYPDKAVQLCKEKDDVARQDGNPWNLAFAFGGLGSWVYEYRAEFAVLMQRAAECERIGRENGLSFFVEVQAPRTRAVALIRAGNLKEGIEQLSKYIDLPMTTLDMRPYMLTLLAEGIAAAGNLEEGLRTISQSITQVEQSDWQGHAHYAEAMRVKAMILSNLGRGETAEKCYQKALGFARKQQAKSWELRIATSYSRLLQQQARHAEALELLQPIYEWFTEGLRTRDVLEAKAVLTEGRERG